LSFVV